MERRLSAVEASLLRQLAEQAREDGDDLAARHLQEGRAHVLSIEQKLAIAREATMILEEERNRFIGYLPKEKPHAAQARIVAESHLVEHQNGKGGGQAAQAGGRDRAAQGRQGAAAP
jgi:hypothetical protein